MLERLLFKQTKNITITNEDVEKSASLDTVGRNINRQVIMGNTIKMNQNIKNGATI